MSIYFRLILLAAALLPAVWLPAQRKGNLLVVADSPCSLIIDGKEEGTLAANEPARFSLREGEHFVQAKALDGGMERNERVNVIGGEQRVLEVVFQTRELPAIALSELSLTVPGGMSPGAGSPDLYYALAAGDVLLLDLAPQTQQGTNHVKVVSHPEGTVLFTGEGLASLSRQRIGIVQEGIYRIIITTPHSFDRKVQLRVARIPLSPETAAYDTRVAKRRRYDVVSVQEPSMHWLNSYSNAYLRGGSDRLLIPITLPANTVEWYYIISASRNREEIANNLKTVSLVRDIAKAVLSGNPAAAAINFSFNLITQPPGSDYCDVFLLDKTNQRLFMEGETFQSIPEGTRENITSAKVKMTQQKGNQLYIGLQNRDTFNGLAVGIEIAAIVAHTYWERENK